MPSSAGRRCAAALVAMSVAACAPGDTAAPDDVPEAAVGHREGSAAAPVHMIYFDDYVCDDCADFTKQAVEPLREEWIAKGRARLTMVDVAWKRGSVEGSAAAWCANEQGQFWAMHDTLFARQEVWKREVDIPAKLVEYAGELGLDTAEFRACTSREEQHVDRVRAAERATRRFGVRGTPAFVINGQLYYGSQSWPWVEQVLLAHEKGTPEAAPPPPFRIPKKSIVDSARLKQLEDSARAAGRMGSGG